jgi:hypothetical protein
MAAHIQRTYWRKMMLAKFFWLVLFLYFVPSLVAIIRRKSDAGAIFALNLFLGWSLLGWVVSLVWSLKGERDFAVTVEVDQNNSHGSTSNTQIRTFAKHELDSLDDKVRLHLIDKYRITKNAVLDKYVIDEKTYGTLEEVLDVALKKYKKDVEIVERADSSTKKKSNETKSAQAEVKTNRDQNVKAVVYLIAFVILIWTAFYMGTR